MNNRKLFRLLVALAHSILLVCSLSITAFAIEDEDSVDLYDEDEVILSEEIAEEADEIETVLPGSVVESLHEAEVNMPVETSEEISEIEEPQSEEVTDDTVVEESVEETEDESNAYAKDISYDETTNKQFITIQTKNGNTFYIIIDYDSPTNEDEEQYQTYFLNTVDETDLFALLDDETVEELTTCTCDTHCEVGAANTDCPVCKNNMSECKGTVTETEEPTEDEANETTDNDEEPYINEDDEPEFAEDEEEPEDEDAG
ncbi:MAG: DUF4366 domain-containing protein [Oscillospiraceae bacterium]|nr:DUF4366 domain-containing protein [Oscillospiraceae bacterium]